MGTRFYKPSQIDARINNWRRRFLWAVRNGTWDETIPFIVTDMKSRLLGNGSLITDEELKTLEDDYYTDYLQDLLNPSVYNHRILFEKAGILEAMEIPQPEDMQTMSLFAPEDTN